MLATVMFGMTINPLYSKAILSLYKHTTVAMPNPTVILIGRHSESPLCGGKVKELTNNTLGRCVAELS